MKFPGSKLLHRFDLAAQQGSLEELLRSSRSSGFTGLVEVAHEGAIGLIFYYIGAEVNALYRAGGGAVSGQAALEGMRGAAHEGGSTVSVFELPLDLAYLMRGLTGRQRLPDAVRNSGDLQEILRRLEKTEHTGTLETQGDSGSAVVLLVRGRVSNVYFESADGMTYDQVEARAKLEEAAAGGLGQPFLGQFSREAWKTRHEVRGPMASRLQRPDPRAPEAVTEEMAARRAALDELSAEAPGMRQAFVLDLLTGVVLGRVGRSSVDRDVAALAEMLPALLRDLRARVEGAEGAESLEFVEVSTERVSILAAVVSETQEALVLLADRSQPIALVTATLHRVVRTYTERAAPTRRRGMPPSA
jgi:hypothetical protein